MHMEHNESDKNNTCILENNDLFLNIWMKVFNYAFKCYILIITLKVCCEQKAVRSLYDFHRGPDSIAKHVVVVIVGHVM